jgi:hypothetical protein
VPHANNDGDSFHVRCGADEFVLRLYFVDTPETNLLYPERTREQAEHFGASLDDTLKAGARARSFVREALRGPFTVTTRKASAPGRAKDPRFYGMVEVGGRNLDEMLVLQGLARAKGVAASVPVVLGISGPRGLAVAAEVADGIIGSSANSPEGGHHFDWVCQMTNGTVLDDGEAPDSPRAMQAAGHGAALVYHSAYERGMVESLPNGAEFKRLADALPERTRHLAMHDRHLVALNDLDQRFMTVETLARFGRALTVEAWQQRLRDVEAAGATELIYQPAGEDIPRELAAFASMAGLGARS